MHQCTSDGKSQFFVRISHQGLSSSQDRSPISGSLLPLTTDRGFKTSKSIVLPRSLFECTGLGRQYENNDLLAEYPALIMRHKLRIDECPSNTLGMKQLLFVGILEKLDPFSQNYLIC
jgi:hypothetical protein